MNRLERLFPKRLDGVSVKFYFPRAAQLAQFSHRLNRADFIIRGHDRNQHRVRTNRFFERGDRNNTFSINGKLRDLEPFIFSEVLAAMKNRMMLDGRRDDMPAFLLKQPRGPENCEVDAFRAAP